MSMKKVTAYIPAKLEEKIKEENVKIYQRTGQLHGNISEIIVNALEFYFEYKDKVNPTLLKAKKS